MAEQKDSPNLFNPFMLWADWGMRAAEAAIASTQNLTNGADRVTRAVAETEASETSDLASEDDEESAGTATAFDSIANMQRMAWDMAAQGWSRWMSAVAGMLTAGSGLELANRLTGKDNPLQAVRDSLRPASWGEKPETRGRNKGALEYPQLWRMNGSGNGEAQRAMASDGPKPRRRAAAKKRTTAKRASRSR